MKQYTDEMIKTKLLIAEIHRKMPAEEAVKKNEQDIPQALQHAAS